MTLKALTTALSLLTPYDTPGCRKTRIGAPNDGGYVMIDQFEPSQVVFSYGLSWNIAFELDLAKRGHRIFMFDHTIEALTLQHENFTWLREGIAATSQPEDHLFTLSHHVERLAPDQSGMILKIDVEGAEWDVLADAPVELLCRFDQVVMELHDLRLFGDVQWRQRAMSGLGKLARYFTLHSVHGNNHAPLVMVDGLVPVPDVIEVSYIRRELAERRAFSGFLPTHLDRANDPTRPDLPLLFFPYLPMVGSGRDGAADDAVGNMAERVDQTLARHLAETQLTAASQHKLRAMTGTHPSASRSIAPESLLKILCVSVHPVLEFDEIRLFERMGHDVFSLGFYFDRTIAGDLRPALPESEWHRACREAFIGTGCQTVAGRERWQVTRDFCARFDLIIVHHNHSFIAANWAQMSGMRIVWRTIGQETHWAEDAMRPYRAQGVKIVRWSPEERGIDRYIGSDDIIRAVKDPEDWSGWTGDVNRIITFNNNFTAREDSLSFRFHAQCVAGLPFDLYGLDNADIADWRGVADYSQQKALLQSHCAAFVTGSIPAPYTLGFIEAWMTGIPVVHIGRQRFSNGAAGIYEIDRLIVDGESGFLVEEVSEARSILLDLLADRELRMRVSTNGRAAAIKLFGIDRAIREWSSFFRDHITC